MNRLAVLAALMAAIGAHGVVLERNYNSSACSGDPTEIKAFDEAVYLEHLVSQFAAMNATAVSGVTNCFSMNNMTIQITMSGATCTQDFYTSADCSGNVLNSEQIFNTSECDSNDDGFQTTECVASAPSGAKDVTCLTSQDFQTAQASMTSNCASSCTENPTSCEGLDTMLGGCASSCTQAEVDFLLLSLKMDNGCDAWASCTATAGGSPSPTTTAVPAGDASGDASGGGAPADATSSSTGAVPGLAMFIAGFWLAAVRS